MTKFKDKYRIESARAKWWDYNGEGYYFITICTKDRKHFFGEIIDGKMKLSQAGVIADILCHEIPNRNKNVKLGEFVVMPNHIHGIVDVMAVDDVDGLVPRIDVARNVYTGTTTGKNQTMAKISPKPNSISAIIRSYKSAVTRHGNRLEIENGWQTRFHDHIIRNNQERNRIAQYILNNPKNWDTDKFMR